MKRFSSVLGAVAGLLVLNMVVAGCGGGGDDSPPTSTGTWGFVDPTGAQDTMTLAESGTTVSGTTTRGATVTGTRNGSNVNFDMHYPRNYTITVVVVIDGDSMSGTVTDSNGNSGTIEFQKIDTDGDGDLTPGTYTGTETINITVSGYSTSAGTVPFSLQVDGDGQVVLPTGDITSTGGGVTAHTMISHSQTGNSFTLSLTSNLGGYGTLTLTYSGTATGDLISGTISGSGPYGMVISGTFTATRTE